MLGSQDSLVGIVLLAGQSEDGIPMGVSFLYHPPPENGYQAFSWE